MPARSLVKFVTSKCITLETNDDNYKQRLHGSAAFTLNGLSALDYPDSHVTLPVPLFEQVIFTNIYCCFTALVSG